MRRLTYDGGNDGCESDDAKSIERIIADPHLRRSSEPLEKKANYAMQQKRGDTHGGGDAVAEGDDEGDGDGAGRYSSHIPCQAENIFASAL